MLRRMVWGGLVAAVLATGSPGPVQAQMSVNIGINIPPTPPPLVVVPGTPVAYAPAVGGNYFFYGGHYYVFSNNTWFVAPRFNGPWVVVAPAYVPWPLLTVPVRYYRVPPPHWRGWRREAPPRWDSAWGHQWKAEHKDYEREMKEARRGYH